MKKLCTFPLVLLSSIVFSQYSISEIPQDGYLKDFDIAVDIIQKQHPNPYRFHSKEIIAKKIDSLRNIVKKDPSYISLLMNNPTRIIGDGHSSFSADSNYFENILSSLHFFPLQIYVQNGQLFVNGSNPYAIEVGSEIMEINGISSKELLQAVPKAADGNIKVEDIDVSFYIPFILKNRTNDFSLRYKTSSGEQKTMKVKGIKYPRFYYESRHSVLPVDLISENAGIYGYTIDSDTYYLSVKSFSYDESFFYERLKKYFQEIKDLKIKNLILDIRNNPGGAISNVPLLYSFIANDKTFNNEYKYGTKVVDINYNDHLVDPQTNRYYSDKDIADQNNFMRQRFDKAEKGDYYFGNSRLDNTYIKSYPRDGAFFDGKIVLLINNRTFSAATYFASLFQSEKRGAIVGKETGSCSNFTTAAWFLTYRLPHTKSTISIPRTEIFFNSDDKENVANCKGVIPDHTVNTQFFLQSLKEHKDPDLEYSLTLFSK
ncbi:S41 family peptidase [Chryseobacterium sp. WLY505]|uniref:S41 family peptidase n=1 Tax=Chryseobacterium sp. WLY505 TaxID=3068892 RepID=UPI002796A014|nr:S41 family peptidase [Chryseobacterium sp. WLY505]MDQ1856202.1 S41 family peptidase [Chryseobacterium sp. WLY505]